MSTTFGKFKSDIRGRIWPPGSAEQDNLVASHDKDFIDALIDLQTWVACLQQDNTDIFPQCSTTYNCGLTVLPCPRGIIKRVSIIDKIDPLTHEESADAADDYCTEIAYPEVDFCHVKRYLDRSRHRGCCHGIGSWFGLPFYGHRPPPVPTDADLPPGLPTLPLGFHYPQTSTDRTHGRAGAGVWAKERGNIYIGPWIQSTETVIVTWDGIKRLWNSGDPVDDDPLLSQAVEAYVRWQHARKWDKDEQAAADSMSEYNNARAMLIHQCREETRTRNCEPSHARATSIGVATLYYNDQSGSYTAKCPDGQTGTAVTVNIDTGTVGSNYSVADANAKAQAQAKSEAEAQLVCTAIPTVYYSSRDFSYNATCATDGTQEDGAPAPTGDAVSVTIKAGTGFPTATSQAEADEMALALATSKAIAGLSCTYGNAPQTATKACSDGVTGLVSATVGAGQKTSGTQAAADQLAKTEAQNQANAAFDPGVCPEPAGTLVYNTSVGFGQARVSCRVGGTPLGSFIAVNVTVPVHTVTEFTTAKANLKAINTAQEWANVIAQNALIQQPPPCGQTIVVIYPNFPHFG